MRLLGLALGLVVALLVAAVVSRGLPELETRWRLQAGSAVVGSPEVEGPDLFLATRAGTLVAAAAESGEARWRFETGERVMAGPVVEGGVVYVSTEVPGSNAGSVFAVDARTGGELWRYATEVAKLGAPAVYGGMVYLSAGDVIALDALTGEVRWRQAVEGAGTVVAGTDVVVVSTSRGLAALDPTTGGLGWALPTAAAPRAPALVTGDVVLSDDGVQALLGLDAGDGGERWRAAVAGLLQASMATGNMVMVATTEGVLVLDARSGDQRWREDRGAADVRIATDGTVVGATSAGRLTLFDAATGDVLGVAGLDGESQPTPAAAGGRVYVAEGETVTAFDRPVD